MHRLALNHGVDWNTVSPSNIRVTDIFTARAGSHHRTGLRTMGIVKNEVDPARNRRFSGPPWSGRALLREKSLGVASILMGVWHSEDCSRSPMKKRHW